jgi:hypothetical protein
MSKLKPNPSENLRKIPSKDGSIRGTTPDGKKFESLLERDFYLLLAFDPGVGQVFPQSVKVPFLDEKGKERTYFPDAFFHYVPDTKGIVRPSVLAEVKPRAILEAADERLKLKLAAAKSFAEQRGWEFKVFTEDDIRTPLLANAYFLRPFGRRVPEPEIRDQILNTLQELLAADVETLLAAIYRDKWNQAMLLPYVWHLVGTRDIYANLDVPLQMTTPIWRSKSSL